MIAAEDADTGRRMSPQDLLHNMQFFIVAGHETTALALSWALFLLANDRETQARVAAEARGRARRRGRRGRRISSGCRWSSRCWRRRCGSTRRSGFLARNVLAPDRLYDRDIAPNDTVFLNIYALHRHRLLWEDPDAFDPGHFAPERAAGRDRYQYLPFGAGPRICVGANFAMMQARIILATLVARFDFAPSGPPPMPVMHMTVRPDPGVTLVATPAA